MHEDANACRLQGPRAVVVELGQRASVDRRRYSATSVCLLLFPAGCLTPPYLSAQHNQQPSRACVVVVEAKLKTRKVSVTVVLGARRCGGGARRFGSGGRIAAAQGCSSRTRSSQDGAVA